MRIAFIVSRIAGTNFRVYVGEPGLGGIVVQSQGRVETQSMLRCNLGEVLCREIWIDPIPPAISCNIKWCDIYATDLCEFPHLFSGCLDALSVSLVVAPGLTYKQIMPGNRQREALIICTAGATSDFQRYCPFDGGDAINGDGIVYFDKSNFILRRCWHGDIVTEPVFLVAQTVPFSTMITEIVRA